MFLLGNHKHSDQDLTQQNQVCDTLFLSMTHLHKAKDQNYKKKSMNFKMLIEVEIDICYTGGHCSFVLKLL